MTAKRMLKKIDRFLDTAKTGEADKLWSVLSALRGPDVDNQQLKATTTACIRTMALPEAKERLGHFLDFAPPENYQEPPINEYVSSHFRSHIIAAKGSLDKMAAEDDGMMTRIDRAITRFLTRNEV